MLKTEAIGRLTRDAQTNSVNGKTVINFSVAVDTGYGDKKKAVYLDCGYWSERTGIVPFLLKGTQVYIEGEPSIREWESNGKKGVAFQVNVRSVQLLGGGKASENGAANSNSQGYAPQQDDEDSDLPF